MNKPHLRSVPLTEEEAINKINSTICRTCDAEGGEQVKEKPRDIRGKEAPSTFMFYTSLMEKNCRNLNRKLKFKSYFCV